MTEFRFIPDEAGLRQVLQGQSGPVVHWMTDNGRQLDNAAKAEAPVVTGNLRARHEFAVEVEGEEVVLTVGTTADYGMAVHEGRHIDSTASHRGRTVRVRGKTRGNPWLERALNRFGLTLHRGR